MSLNSGETLQPFKPLNQLIYDSAGNLIGIQNDRANGSDLRIGGGSGVDGTFATLIATTALKLNSGATFDLYNTADQTTNYERLRAEWSSNTARMFTQFGGSATARSLQIGVAGSAGGSPTAYVNVQTNGLPLFNFVGFNTAGTSTSGLIALTGGSLASSSGTQYGTVVNPTINQSGTAGYTALDVNPTESATGSGTKLLQRWAVGGTAVGAVSNGGVFSVNGLGVSSSGSLGFLSSTAIGTAGFDLTLARDAADILALRRSTNAQTFRLYNTYTDGSNYRRWNLSWNTTTAIMQVVGAGTGTNGNLAVGNAALATTDTVGYFMIPSSAGAPTGVPADIPTGQVALHFDSTNNKLYVYDGGWLSTAALT